MNGISSRCTHYLNRYVCSNFLIDKFQISYQSNMHRLIKICPFRKSKILQQSHFLKKHCQPFIIDLALNLPRIIDKPIPLLKRGDNESVSLSKVQIACLLANAFLCTFPQRNLRTKFEDFKTYPSINFNELFQATGDYVVEKIKCICNYFRRVMITGKLYPPKIVANAFD